MKIHGALALLALPGAFGFAPSNNNVAASTALFSSGAPVSGGPSLRTGPPGVDPAIAGGMAVGGGRPPVPAPQGALERFAVKYDSIEEIVVQGGALRTWSFPTMSMGRANLALTTQGPPEGNPARCGSDF